MIKNPNAQRDGSLRAREGHRLRIDLLEGQSSSIAKMLTKAIRNRGRIEELLWVLEEKVGQNVLDLQVAGKNSSLSVKKAIEKLRAGELKIDDLPPDAQAMVRKGALEMKNARKG
jgi:hypothetical protein